MTDLATITLAKQATEPKSSRTYNEIARASASIVSPASQTGGSLKDLKERRQLWYASVGLRHEEPQCNREL